MGIEINQYKGTHNLSNTSRGANGIKYIAIHYVAGTTSKAGSAKNVCAWFANPSCSASCDFSVDDSQIWQYNPTPESKYSWQIGGNAASYTKNNSLAKTMLNKAKNSNSIGIEICNMKNGNSYYFTEAALANAVKLTKYLMSKYNIDIDHVIMHNMVTGKSCPAMWTTSESALKGWYDFKARLTAQEAAASTQATTTTAATATVTETKVEEEDEDMTQETFDKMLTTAFNNLAQKDPSDWSATQREWAESNGYIAGDGNGHMMYKKPLTREEFITILYKVMNS